MMLDIATGLEYLHGRKPQVLHRDIKSKNILITDQGRARITDFGLSTVRPSSGPRRGSACGTFRWQAPELWEDDVVYDHKVDVFACAIVFWEMLQWHKPVKSIPWQVRQLVLACDPCPVLTVEAGKDQG